jgi:hypothetical protein
MGHRARVGGITVLESVRETAFSSEIWLSISEAALREPKELPTALRREARDQMDLLGQDPHSKQQRQ